MFNIYLIFKNYSRRMRSTSWSCLILLIAGRQLAATEVRNFCIWWSFFLVENECYISGCGDPSHDAFFVTNDQNWSDSPDAFQSKRSKSWCKQQWMKRTKYGNKYALAYCLDKRPSHTLANYAKITDLFRIFQKLYWKKVFRYRSLIRTWR